MRIQYSRRNRRCQAAIPIDCDPKIAAGLMRALFFVSLHQADFNQDVYPQMFDLLLDLVASHLVQA
jgi:hypothetical protein